MGATKQDKLRRLLDNMPPDYAHVGDADALVAAHVAAADPHPGYLTPAEGNAAYDVLGAGLLAVPVGGIIGWSGTVASIPANYALCDGVANAPGPDWSDLFVV